MSKVLHRLCVRDSLDNNAVTFLKGVLESFESVLHGLGFCLSAKGDLLSQWRGYAADGQGLSIGFSREYLMSLTERDRAGEARLSLLEVLYDESRQEECLMPVYADIKSHISSGKLQRPRPVTLLGGTGGIESEQDRYRHESEQYDESLRLLSLKAFGALGKMYALKSDAFTEEEEWRLLSPFVSGAGEKCQYRSAGNRLIPYRTVELVPNGSPEILSVIIGPKNLTPKLVVENFLEQNGFHAVEVKGSVATYR